MSFSKLITAMALMLGVYIIQVQPAHSATAESVETWDTGTAGWISWDCLNKTTYSLINNSGCLGMVFEDQSMSMPEVAIIRADQSASGGSYVGDYMSAGITNISFKLFCDSMAPAEIRLYFTAGGSADDWWYCDLDVPAVGQWVQYSVSLDYWAGGWKTGAGNGNPGRFRTALKNVAWVGIEICRNGSTQRQVYSLDDFVLHGADKTKDSDGDGMSDWAEFLAGTNPQDPNDALKTDLDAQGGGVTLRWRSVGNRVYGILRCSDLSIVPAWTNKIATGIDATPPQNSYIDTTATGTGPYYYKIELEQ